MNAVFQDRRKAGRLDLEAVETVIRSAMHEAGAAALTKLLEYDPPDEDQRTIPCSCGHSARYKELRSKTVLTVLGPVKLNRPYYLCGHCSKGQCPVDVELGVSEIESSPGVRRMEAVMGSEMPFASGCGPMKVLAGLDVPAKAIERASEAIGRQIARRDAQEIGRSKQLVLPMVAKQNIPKMYVLMDGVQIPVVRKETEGRAGRIEGQPARTRECKLGCVFTQTSVDEEGWPVRDPDSTTYVGAVESAEEFGFRLYTEAWSRGWEWATIRIVIGDGAVWIWNLADVHFPGAIQIVDLYHAREHLWKIAAWLHPNDPAAKKLWMTPMKDLLDEGKIEPLVARLRGIAAEHAPAQPALSEAILTEAEYFESNTHRMRYPEFRAKGLFVGSGVIEAGCKAVIGSRLKQSGMFWTVRGANDIIALRCCRLNGRFEDYWEESRAA
ncbi:MAG TPA: ISKra4 family transposase [Candidatus Sulfotelmatobacter sp.]